jgi:hypothetical protein
MKDKILTAINLYRDGKIPKETLHACLVGFGLSDSQLTIIAPACEPLTFETFKKVHESGFEFTDEAKKSTTYSYALSKVFHFLVHNEKRDIDTYMRVKHPEYWGPTLYQVGSASYNKCRNEYHSLTTIYPTLERWISISPTCQRIVEEKKELVNTLVELAFPSPILIENAEHQ